MVVDGVLGSLWLPETSSPYLTIRLTVYESLTLAKTVQEVVVKYQSLWNGMAGPDPFSPNGDEFQDLLLIQTGITWDSNWGINIYKQVGLTFASPAVATRTGTGDQILIQWNGLRDSGGRAGNGNYLMSVYATATGASQTAAKNFFFSIDQSGDAIRIVSPLDGDLLSNNESVVLETDFEDEVNYTVRLEFGGYPAGTVIAQQSTLPVPFAVWDTLDAPNGTVALTAVMISEDGTTHSDTINVENTNLLMTSIASSVIDPLGQESTSFSFDSGRSSGDLDPNDTVTIDIFKANTQFGTSSDEGSYAGTDPPGATIPLRSITQSIATGIATVPWDGTDQGGMPLPSGEYTVFATANYADSSESLFQPEIEPGFTQNGTLSGLGVDLAGSNQFDPYFGDRINVQFSASETEWISAVYGQDLISSEVLLANHLYDAGGPYSIEWDGRTWGNQGLTNEASVGQSLSNTIFLRASRAPIGIVALRNKSLQLSDVEIDPVVIFPSMGQSASIDYTLSKDALVTINVYHTTNVASVESAELFVCLQNAESKLAGSHSMNFDGTGANGVYPDSPGTYSIEIVAEDPVHSTYRDVKRHLIRILY